MDTPQPQPHHVESLLLACTRVNTFIGPQALTAASGFFFRHGVRLFLITSRHVLLDLAAEHKPQRIEFALHAAGADLTRQYGVSLPLYDKGIPLWRQATDSGGDVDVAAVEVPSMLMPRHPRLFAFTPSHIQVQMDAVRLGQPLLVVGFPLGFHDTLHHLPVARGAVVASAFGVRFQGQGCFVTDAPMHSGSSGAPVVRHDPYGECDLPWQLLGVHASRMDMASRDTRRDASLGLNLAWYSDVLLILTR
ncbi:trypsin-like peptidase domain-containing protein [Roseateles sp. DAIF2]|uniref:S1 family peptidase n=1 Tax=Roseateles sp. DAIF2 TaxID=2714952 RepID=UPI0018A2AF7F|nr:serine protease [Roseateles sp. DAIF2]QPF74043.1 trypsin-like peptidase domain-containing protein [Roseateles sp. DAIF2]